MLSSIEWGSIEAGQSVSVTAYVKNAGDENTTLSLGTENWVPEAVAGAMELSWNYGGATLQPGDVVKVTLMLMVDAAISGVDNFSFDIVIVGLAS